MYGIRFNKHDGSGALSGKMLLVRIAENNKIDDYFRSGVVKLGIAVPRRVRKGIGIGPRRVRTPLQVLEIS